MGITVNLKNRAKLGDAWLNTYNVVVDDTYKSGGFEIAPKDFGIRAVRVAIPAPAGGYVFEYDHDNNKLKSYTTTNIDIASGGTASANTYIVEDNDEIAIAGSGAAFNIVNNAKEVASGVSINTTIRTLVLGL